MLGIAVQDCEIVTKWKIIIFVIQGKGNREESRREVGRHLGKEEGNNMWKVPKDLVKKSLPKGWYIKDSQLEILEVLKAGKWGSMTYSIEKITHAALLRKDTRLSWN